MDACQAHPLYPYWIDPNNPVDRSKRAPADSGGPTFSNEPAPHPLLHESSSYATAASRPMDRDKRGRGHVRRPTPFMCPARGLVGMFAICRSHTADIV